MVVMNSLIFLQLYLLNSLSSFRVALKIEFGLSRCSKVQPMSDNPLVFMNRLTEIKIVFFSSHLDTVDILM